MRNTIGQEPKVEINLEKTRKSQVNPNGGKGKMYKREEGCYHLYNEPNNVNVKGPMEVVTISQI